MIIEWKLMKKRIEKIKNWLFEKINKIDKTFAESTEKKEDKSLKSGMKEGTLLLRKKKGF